MSMTDQLTWWHFVILHGCQKIGRTSILIATLHIGYELILNFLSLKAAKCDTLLVNIFIL